MKLITSKVFAVPPLLIRIIKDLAIQLAEMALKAYLNRKTPKSLDSDKK